MGNQEEWHAAVKRTHLPKRVLGAGKGERLMSEAWSSCWGSSEGFPVFDEPGVRCNITVDGS